MAAAKKLTVQQIALSDIQIADGRRAVDMAAVQSLAESIAEIGLQTPITLRDVEVPDPETGEVENRWFLVTGRHRLEAFRQLGRPEIDAVFFGGDDTDAELWEISENLHRADLSRLDHGEQVARWIRLTEGRRGVSGQHVPKPQGGRPEGGIRAAARELPLEGTTEEAKRASATRALKVASLSDEAKETARQTGLDNNQSALLAAAKETTPEGQVVVLNRKAQAKASKVKLADDPLNDFEAREKWIAQGMKWWNKGSAEWRAEFDARRGDAPIMDRRFA